jgi:hypothetical protein
MDFVEIRTIDLTKLGYKSDILNIHTPGLSDILRINTLYENGGLWSDSDIIWLKPMDEIANIDVIRNYYQGKMESKIAQIHSSPGEN